MPSEIRRPFFQDPGYLFFFFPFCLVQSFSHALLSPFHHIFDTAALLRNRELDSRCSFCFKAFAVGFLGFTIFDSSYFRVRLISRVSPLDMISICVLGLDHFPWTFHPAVGNFRYVLIFSLFYFLFFLLGGCLEFFFDYVLGAIRVGFLCFFLVVGEKKIPWTNCIYLFAFSLNFVLFTGRRGVLGCFILS